MAPAKGQETTTSSHFSGIFADGMKGKHLIAVGGGSGIGTSGLGAVNSTVEGLVRGLAMELNLSLK